MTNKIDRRQFTRLILGGMALSILDGCGFRQASTQATPLPQARRVDVTPSSFASVRPTLRNDNVPGFYVRYYRPFEAVDPTQWILSVKGLVKKPVELSLSDIQALPIISQTSRMKCVECWSAAAKWDGFHLRSLLAIIEPLPTAKWIHFRCADGYYESLSIDDLLDERVIFAHRMNDRSLPDIYGAPLRLIIPPLYGYKNPKAITQLIFAEEELRGYWPSVGPYTQEGIIEPGSDHPLDIGETRRIQGGEVIYPDGIEFSK